MDGSDLKKSINTNTKCSSGVFGGLFGSVLIVWFCYPYCCVGVGSDWYDNGEYGECGRVVVLVFLDSTHSNLYYGTTVLGLLSCLWRVCY